MTSKKKYSMAVQDFSKEEFKTSHIATPPPRGLRLQSPEMGHSQWGCTSPVLLFGGYSPSSEKAQKRYGHNFWGMEGGGRRRTIRK